MCQDGGIYGVSQKKVSRNEQGYEQLTLFREGSRASLFPWLESKKVKRTTVICGRKCSELSENLRRLGLLVRMYLESCELPGKQFVRTWSVRDTLSPYLILKLRLSEQGTGEKGCSLWRTPGAEDAVGRGEYKDVEKIKKRWEKGHQVLLCQQARLYPTPNTMDSLPPKSQEALTREATQARPGRTSPANLRDVVAVQEGATMWPTTTASQDYKPIRPLAPSEANGTHGTMLVGAVGDTNPELIGGQLNPTWVEWLMGFPTGWTDLKV